MNLQHQPVDYDDSQHLYSMQGRKYVSASQLYELFKEPFPEDAHIRYAEKHGGTPEYWKAKWAEKNQKSTHRGTIIHDANEVALTGMMIDRVHGQEYKVMGDVIRDEDPWYNRPDGVYLEKKLWHHGYRIAGRADKITITTERRYGALDGMLVPDTVRWAHVDDYKTNEKLDRESYQFKNGNYKMMKPPIGHLMDCNWIHYCLQLSTYMLMLEYQGFLPGKMRIKHYPHPTAEDPNPVPVWYDEPYLKKEVVLMCTYLNRSHGRM